MGRSFKRILGSQVIVLRLLVDVQSHNSLFPYSPATTSLKEVFETNEAARQVEELWYTLAMKSSILIVKLSEEMR